MHTQHTIMRLRALRLEGMARAFEEQLTQPATQSLSFEERFGLLVDRETSWRDSKRIDRLLKAAKLKVSSASIEDIDYCPSRGLDWVYPDLSDGFWLEETPAVEALYLCGF